MRLLTSLCKDEEEDDGACSVLTVDELRQRKPEFKEVQYRLLLNEAKHHPMTWMPYNSAGQVKSKKHMSYAMKTKMHHAMNFQFPIEMFTGAIGVYPANLAEEKKLAKDTFINSLPEDDEKNGPILDRFNGNDAAFLKSVLTLVRVLPFAMRLSANQSSSYTIGAANTVASLWRSGARRSTPCSSSRHTRTGPNS